MRLRRFCAKCGKQFGNNDKIFENYLCQNCYEISHQNQINDIMYKFTLRRCIICGAVSLMSNKQEFSWQFIPNDIAHIDFLTDLFFNTIFDKYEQKENRGITLFFNSETDIFQEADIDMLIQEQTNEGILVHEQNVSIKLRDIMCPHCAMKKGGRFTSVLQLRFFDKEDEHRLELMLNECKLVEDEERFKNPENFISRVVPVNNGYDLKLSSNMMLKSLTARIKNRFPVIIKFSKRLMGIDHETGGELYRHYTSIKLVPVREDSIVQISNDRYKVKKIVKNKMTLINLKTNKVSQQSLTIFEKQKWRIISKTGEKIKEGN